MSVGHIPDEIREQHMAICNKCDKRAYISKLADMHFDWIDCPYDCENDLDHYISENMKGETE